MNKTYKWEALKAKAIDLFLLETERYSGIACGKGKNLAIAAIIESNLGSDIKVDPSKDWKFIYMQVREDVVKSIQNADVRCYSSLIEKLPSIVRKQDVGMTPVIDMDEDGMWIIGFD